MRTRTLERAVAAATQEPGHEAVAFRLGEQTWVWLQALRLFMLEADGDRIPKEVLSTLHPDDERFLLAAVQEKPVGAQLPVERADGAPTKIGGVPIAEEALLGGLEEAHGPLTWRAWESVWLVARAPGGQVVALWQMPDGQHIDNVFMIRVGDAVWTSNNKFALRLLVPTDRIPAGGLSEVPSFGAWLERIAARARTGRVVPVAVTEVEDAGAIATIGPSRVPAEQVALARGHHGTEITWWWSGPLDPMVAVLSPIPPTTNGGQG